MIWVSISYELLLLHANAISLRKQENYAFWAKVGWSVKCDSLTMIWRHSNVSRNVKTASIVCSLYIIVEVRMSIIYGLGHHSSRCTLNNFLWVAKIHRRHFKRNNFMFWRYYLTFKIGKGQFGTWNMFDMCYFMYFLWAESCYGM